MINRTIFILFIMALLIGCSNSNDIRSPRKNIKKIDQVVIAEGRWKAIPGTTAHVISKINFTSITCDLNSKTCTENISFVRDPKEDKIYKNYMLFSNNFAYDIIEWTNDIITAKWNAPVADVEIRISLKDNFAEKSFRETKARDSESSNPDIYGKWILE